MGMSGGPLPDLLNQNLEAWSPATGDSVSVPGDGNVHADERSTTLSHDALPVTPFLEVPHNSITCCDTELGKAGGGHSL